MIHRMIPLPSLHWGSCKYRIVYYFLALLHFHLKGDMWNGEIVIFNTQPDLAIYFAVINSKIKTFNFVYKRALVVFLRNARFPVHWPILIIAICIFIAISGCLGSTATPGPQTTQQTTAPLKDVTTSIPTKKVVTAFVTTEPTTKPFTSVLTTIPVYPRPLTGKLISGKQLSGGEGELTIDNTGGGSDAIAILTYSGMKEPLSGIFIQKGEKFIFKGIVDGYYDLYFVLGDNWNPYTNKFTNYPSYQKFTDKFSFSTTRTNYMTYRVTLYGTITGNAKTNTVGESNFPKL